MATFSKSWETFFNEGRNMGFRLSIWGSVDDDTGAGTCYWSASTFIPSGSGSYSYRGHVNGDNYLDVNGRRWSLYDMIDNDNFVYTTEPRRTSNQWEYYSGDYTWGNAWLYTLQTDYATGSFSFNTDDNGDYTFNTYLQAHLYWGGSAGIVSCGGSHSIHVDIGRKLWKWTPSTGWQKVAYGHKNANWNKKLHLKKWTPSTGWQESK